MSTAHEYFRCLMPRTIPGVPQAFTEPSVRGIGGSETPSKKAGNTGQKRTFQKELKEVKIERTDANHRLRVAWDDAAAVAGTLRARRAHAAPLAPNNFSLSFY
jgi:hypothetical protein